MQIPSRIPLLDRLVDRPEQDSKPLQAVGHGTRRQVQVPQPPGSQEAFGGPIAEILVQEDLDPDRSAVRPLGISLGGGGAVRVRLPWQVQVRSYRRR